MADVLVRLTALRDRGGLLLDEDGDPLALDVNPAAFPGAHFATFAPKLVEPLIRAATSERGACPTCGTPWVRVVERERGEAKEVRGYQAGLHATSPHIRHGTDSPNAVVGENYMQMTARGGVRSETLGWRPSCPCPPAEPRPCVVMDIFSGAGTTGLVASRLGRSYIGIELSPIYAAMSEARIRDDAPLLVEVERSAPSDFVPLGLFGELA